MDMNFKWTTRSDKLLVVEYWWEEQQGLCCLCGEPMNPYRRQHTSDPDAATIEHLIPRRENGPNTAGNVRLAHGRCNHALGALWERNRHRAANGLPPLTEKWALSSAAGNQKAKLAQEAARDAALNDVRVKEILSRFPGATVTIRYVPLDKKLVSLPRGATLLPIYKGSIGNAPRIPNPKMSVVENARWLAEQGVRRA